MKKAQIKKSVSALAMAAVIAVSLFGYGCGAKPASTSSDAGVSGDFTGTAKGFGGDVSVTLTLTDGEVADGTRLQIRTAGQSQEQTWLLRPVRALLTGLKNTTSGVQVRWGTVPHATGYRVYRKKSGETGWTRVQTITSGKTASWIDPNVSNGTQYAYTVRSVYGQHLSPSCPQKSKYRLTAPRMLTPKNSGKGRITVSWKVNSKASGYQVCYAGNSSFKDSHTVTVSGRNTLSKVLTYAEDFLDQAKLASVWATQKDGASLIARELFENATDINFFVGRAINPAHQNPNLPITFGIKQQLITSLADCLKQMGKHVRLSYF